MQKVYRLLRNNQETGPYTLEEILQLNLKPFDLVWVDGRSAAWRYPSEIETLKAFVPEAIQTHSPYEPVPTAAMEKEIPVPIPQPQKETSKKIFVSMPGKGTQQAMPTPPPPPTRVPSSFSSPSTTLPSFSSIPGDQTKTYSGEARPQNSDAADEDLIQTKYARSLNDVEEDYSNWVYQQKTKPKSKGSAKDLVIAAVVIALIIGGYYVISKPAIVQPISSRQETKPVMAKEKEEPTETKETELANTVTTPVTKSARKKTNSKNLPTNSKEINTASQQIHSDENSIPDKTEEVTTAKRDNSKTQSQPAAKKEKKKLGERLKNIFTKKDVKEKPKEIPNEKPVLEEPKPATNRQATKRNEEVETSTEPDHATLMNMIDVTSNAPENWMMGVSGLKVTVRNRNNIALQTVSVQVLYYDDNDQLLDKKTIYFNNVAAKGKLTMAAPDHKFADHVEFKLVTANAKEERYANNSY